MATSKKRDLRKKEKKIKPIKYAPKIVLRKNVNNVSQIVSPFSCTVLNDEVFKLLYTVRMKSKRKIAPTRDDINVKQESPL